MSNQKNNRKEKNEKSWIKPILIRLGLVLLSSVFFALSFPNPLIKHGFPLIAWFSLIPILTVIKREGIPACAAWGAIYGFSSYSLFNFWLSAFHPLAGIIASIAYMIFLAIVFVFMKLAIVFFPKRGYLVQWLIWLSYEYLRTKGFLGYPYGVMGYSQWKMIPLIQIASITGVWGISALVTFPSFWLSAIAGNKEEFLPQTTPTKTNLVYDIFVRVRELASVFVRLVVKKGDRIPVICWGTAVMAVLIFGFINIKDYSAYPKADIALVQHNTDPWEATRAPHEWQVTESYKRDLENLIRLSDAALADEPKPQMVVWPETAFIPRIYWHNTYRTFREDRNRDTWLIVRNLLNYLLEQEIPFLIGNDDARRDPALNPDESKEFRVDYNAAMLFEDGYISAYYRKMHLVPFTEHFPYKKQFPRIYKWLSENKNINFWEKGNGFTIFEGPGFTFATPICFEDTFGYISANFARKGADVLVGMTNDAWSKSLTAQNQHLGMAVFRAVENNRPMVRSTTSGQTCAIDPNGRVIAEAPPFAQVHLNVSVPLVKGETLYTRYTDYFAVLLAGLTGIMLIFGTVYCTIRLKREPK
ncbi:MAG: apolipoprotein N-acyltransferase [Treponema sp.]|nr:apolipoprotein N-acyltransferase [Treponema sp.]